MLDIKNASVASLRRQGDRRSRYSYVPARSVVSQGYLPLSRSGCGYSVKHNALAATVRGVKDSDARPLELKLKLLNWSCFFNLDTGGCLRHRLKLHTLVMNYSFKWTFKADTDAT
jgi:hypothetical protein